MLDSRRRAWRGAWIVVTSLGVACAGCAGQWRVIDPVTGACTRVGEPDDHWTAIAVEGPHALVPAAEADRL